MSAKARLDHAIGQGAGMRPILAAGHEGHVKTVRCLLYAKAAAGSVAEGTGTTLATAAAQNGHLEVLELALTPTPCQP